MAHMYGTPFNTIHPPPSKLNVSVDTCLKSQLATDPNVTSRPKESEQVDLIKAKAQQQLLVDILK